MIEAIKSIRVKKMPKYDNFDLANLRRKLMVLMVILPFSAALIGGIQVTFMRGFTLSLKMEGGPSKMSTYTYFLIAWAMACF
jgi:hypothetical protein